MSLSSPVIPSWCRIRMASGSQTAPAGKQIALLNLEAQHRPIREEILAALTRVIDSQQFILGEEVRKLEEEMPATAAPPTQ
jgi:hypothetical protein